MMPSWPITEEVRIQSFHSFSSTAKSSATSDYGTIPERPSRNEEPNSGKKERGRNTPSSRPISSSSEVQ